MSTIGRDGVRDLGGSVAEAGYELCRRSEGEVQDVVKDEHLAIAARASAYANGRGMDFAGNQVRDFARNSFQENAGHSSAVEGGGIAHELLDIGQRLALDFVSAHAVHGLRSEADVSSDGNFG